MLLLQLKWWKHQKNWKPTSSLGVCELIFDFKKIFSYTNCTELNIEFLKSINEESKRTEDDLDKIMSSGMLLVNNILNGSEPTANQPRISPADERNGIIVWKLSGWNHNFLLKNAKMISWFVLNMILYIIVTEGLMVH